MGAEAAKRDGRQVMGHSALKSAVGTFCSRVFGLGRDVCFSWYWGGSGVAQAAYTLAFSVPNMFRMLFGEGALHATLVPAFSDKLIKEGKPGVWRLAERIISLQIVIVSAVVLLTGLLSYGLLLLEPNRWGEHVPLALKILPILMPYALLICITASFAAILNSLRIFGIPALNPVLFNIVEILGILILSRFFPNDHPAALYIFCGCILLGGVVQMLCLMLVCRRRGFVFHFTLARHDADVKGVLYRIGPGVLGAGVNQVNQLIDKFMVAYLGPLAVSSIANSTHLVYLPVGLFGAAMGNVCLTALSEAAAKEDTADMSAKMEYALRIVLFLSLPCVAFLGVLAEPTVRLFYERGAFTPEASSECAWALLFYVIGIPAFCGVKVAVTVHHAKFDTRTPVTIGICCVLLNLILNLTLIRSLRQGGLALSTSICSWTNFTLLMLFAKKYMPELNFGHIAFYFLRMVMAAILAGAATWMVLNYLPVFPGMPRTIAALWQVAVSGSAGLVAYVMFSIVLRTVPDLHRRKTAAV